MALYTSHHGLARMTGRSIPLEVIEVLQDYGRWARCRHADCFAIDQRGRNALKRDIGAAAYRRLEPKLNAYAVISDDGVLITAAYRLRRWRQR